MTKKEILTRALKLFIEVGFWESSINDLIKEMEISKSDFNYYFKSKDQLICETIDKCFFSHFDNINKITDESNINAKEKLLKIFREYSDLINYLKINFKIRKFNYESIICLTINGIEEYKLMSKSVTNFNERLLAKILCVIEEGMMRGEILDTVESKSTATKILKAMQNSIVIWAINQNFDIKKLFDADFKYLWKDIKLY